MAELWDPWQISERAFPKTGTSSDKLRFLLDYAVLAPSNHNAQPGFTPAELQAMMERPAMRLGLVA
jgi:hypothetical protein